MDTLIISLLVSGSLVVLFLAGFLGRCFDTHFRAKLFRIFTKRDFGIIGICSQDRKNIKKIVVDYENTIIKLSGNMVWIIKGGRIYRQDKPAEGFSFVNSKGELNVNTVRIEEGVPIMYVDSTNLKPLDFYPQETGKVPPEEFGSFASSWIANQIAKGLNVIAEYRNYLLVIILLLFLIIVFLWFLGGKIDEVKTVCGGVHAVGTVLPQATGNGTMVITGQG
jgi:hypothetical protein